MEIFLDSAIIEDVIEASKLGSVTGVTTNPSLIAKSGRSNAEVIQEIAEYIDGPISAEVAADLELAEDMIAEGLELSKIHKNVVIKLPMTTEGLKACKALTDQGIKTNVTLIFSVSQALLAARAGATYVSPFVGRLDDINMDGLRLIEDVAYMFRLHDIDSKIISASIRTPMHVEKSALLGADIATLSLDLIKTLTKHPLTDQGIEKFKKDYFESINK